VVTAPLLFGRLYVLPVIAEFLAQFAEINVRLVLSDRNARLVDDHIDMAVRIGRLPDSSMVATRIGAMRMVTCASPAWLAAHGVPQDPQQLRTLPCVVMEAPVPIAAWQFLQPDTAVPGEVAIEPRLAVSTAEAAVDAAILNVGATRLLHYQVAAAVTAGQLRIILAEYELEPLPIHLLHAARGHMPQKLRRFIDHAVPRLRRALGALEPANP
jgi:DNA-binding transcriptional LysR family regulator